MWFFLLSWDMPLYTCFSGCAQETSGAGIFWGWLWGALPGNGAWEGLFPRFLSDSGRDLGAFSGLWGLLGKNFFKKSEKNKNFSLQAGKNGLQ
jgi:hypothetical protein